MGSSNNPINISIEEAEAEEIKEVEVQFKTPDALLDALMHIPNSSQRGRAKELLAKYIQWGEYATLIFDLEGGTVRVKEFNS